MKPCSVCNQDKKISVKIDKVGFCIDCLKFIEKIPKENGRDFYEEVHHQANYLS